MKTRISALGLLACAICIPTVFADDEAVDYIGLLAEATAHLKGFSSHDQVEAILNVAGAAKAVVIIPDEHSAALIVGYKRGIGAMYRRHGAEWSDPIFMKFSKFSVGVQAGGTNNEVIVMVLTDSVADGVIDGVSDLGGSGGFALGSLGFGSSGGGSLGGGLEMISVSTRAGLQLGGSIENTQVEPADDFNVAAWGADYDIKAILSKPGGDLEHAQELREALVDATQTSFGM